MGLARDWFIVGSFFHGGKVTTSNENGPAFGMENVPVRRLLRGVSGATGARKRPASGGSNRTSSPCWAGRLQ